jgi:hypothetical protein
MGSINEINKTGSAVIDLDGYVTEAEWGKPIAEISRDYAATLGGAIPSGENTYYWHMADGVSRLDLSKDFSYKVWMAWDEEYFYLAAVVEDPDGPAANVPGGDIWNGDTLQFIMDPDGPNSISGGTTYNPAVDRYPWLSAERGAGSWKYSGKTCNIGVAYVNPGSAQEGGVGMYDMAHRYNPTYEAVYAGDEIDYYSTNWHGYEIYAYDFDGSSLAANPLMGEKYAYAAVRPVSKNDPDNTRAYLTTYEVAIPWELMDGSYYSFDEDTQTVTYNPATKSIAAGAEFGFTMAMLNGASGGGIQGSTDIYNSWLTWGSGVCGAQTDTLDYLTAGGSNSLVLVSDELGSNTHVHTFADPTCEAPYTCTVCGYKKGFSVGHNYSSVVTTPLAGNADGVITSTCAYDSTHVVTTTVPAVEKQVYYQFDGTPNAFDDTSEWYDSPANGFAYLYVDDDDNIIKNPDGTDKTTYIVENGEGLFDLSDGKAGTYFQCDHNQRSYSYTYDLQLVSGGFAANYNDDPQEGYVPGIYNIFGGIAPGSEGNVYGQKYAAGFFPTERGATTGQFRIYENVFQSVSSNPDALASYKILAETEVIDLGTDWHNMILVYDETEGAAFFYLDGECIMGAWSDGMKMNGNDQVPFIRKFDIPCRMKGMGIGSTTAFLDDVEITGYTVSCDGEVIGTYEAGETVTLPVPAFKVVNSTPYRFFTWDGADVVRSAFSTANTVNGRSYTLVMPAQNVELTSRFIVVGDGNLDNKVNAKDTTALKKNIAGTSGALTPEQEEALDTNCDGKINAKDTTALKKYIAGTGTFTK